MVYGVCRRLLGDSEAEDVAQECFIKLSQSELRHTQAVGGWLHTVAMNACRDRLRASQRRREREVAFATTDAPQEIGWDDLQVHVDEAVAALPDDLRLPIVYHFLEGRTHQDVAHTLHLTRSGVTRRIQRGIEAVRATLSQRGVIVPSATLGTLLAANAAEAAPVTVTAALAKLALAGTGTKVSAMAVTTLAGWLTVKTVVTVVLASLAAGAGVWYVAGRAPSVEHAAPAIQNPQPLSEPLQLAQAETPQDSQAAEAVAPGIHGVVVNTEGYPRADVQFLKDYPEDLWDGVTSDVSGRFTLPLDAAGTQWMAYSHVFNRAALFTVPQTPPDEPLSVILDYGVSQFNGRVVDPKGDGVAFAHVEVRATTPAGERYALGVYPADINGHYETRDLPIAKGLILEIRVVPPGEETPAEWSKPMALADPPRSLIFTTLTVSDATAQNIRQNQKLEGRRARLEQQLKEHPKSHRYGGVVQDPNGVPVVGASVEVMYSLRQGFSESAHAATGENGSWAVWLPADLSQANLRVQHADYVGTVLTWPNENPPLERLKDGTAVTTMARGISVSGTIRDKAGNPVADAIILPHTLTSRNAGGPEPTANAPIEDCYSVRTQADGSFTVTGLPEGERKLQISAEGFAPSILALDVKPNMPAANVELGEGGTIVGRIVDIDGQPIPGSYIYGSEWRLDRQYSLSLRAHADSEGRFVLHHVPLDGIVSFSFGVERGTTGRKFLSMSSDVLVPRDEPYEVVMYEPPLFEGNVVDDATGAPVTAFRVRTGWYVPEMDIHYWNSMGRINDVSDEHGHFTVQLSRVHVSWPSDTAYVAGIEADGYNPAVTPMQRLGEKSEPTIVRLTRGEPWTGLVRNASGEPARGAKVAWIGPNQKAFIINGQMETGYIAASDVIADSDEGGRFELPPNAESGFLFATHPTGYGWTDASVFQRGDAIELKPWTRLQGTVYQSGQPLASAHVSGQVLAAGDDEVEPPIQWMLNTVTHVDGRYEFAFLPSEPIRIGHAVIGDRHSEMSHTRFVNAEPGQAYTLDLGTAKGSAEGHIDSRNADALAAFREAVDNKVVIAVAERIPDNLEQLTEAYKEEYVPVLEPNGGIHFDGLPAGRYSLRIEVRTPSPDMTCGVGAVRWSGQQEFRVAESITAAAQIPPVTLEPAPVAAAGQAAPDLRAWTFGNEEFDLAKLRGRWVLLDFWAMWCPPCRQGLLRLKPLWERYGASGNVAFVGVNLDPETEIAKQFVEQQHLGWTQVGAEGWGPDNVVIREWSITAIPSLWLIGPDGAIVARDLDLTGAEVALRSAVGNAG
jgi:RNA polymerase sigma factor (sigma-70 family)